MVQAVINEPRIPRILPWEVLRRANHSPEPHVANPFVDVKQGPIIKNSPLDLRERLDI